MTKIIFCVSILLLISCGKSVEDKSDEVEQEEKYPDGVYSALLLPVNGKISSQINGDIRIIKFGDEFKVNINIRSSPGGVHRQSLHYGTRCPKIINDVNKDGYIDRLEAEESIGKIIVPFDQDISAQLAGHVFPSGSYRYSKTTSYYLMLSDLHLPDEIANDQIAKLKENDLPLEGRVVAVYGKGRNIPPTVSGDDLPIACGVLTLMSETHPPQNEDSYEPPPRRPRQSPRPRPQPRPEPEIDIDPGPPPRTNWWDRLRERWRRWWNGDNENFI